MDFIKKDNRVEFVGFMLLILATFFVPIFSSAKNLNHFLLPKLIVLNIFVSLALVFWVIKSLIAKKVSFFSTLTDKPVILLFGSLILSAIFSVDRDFSLAGRMDVMSVSLISFLFFIIYYWLFIQFVGNYKRWKILSNLIISVGLISSIQVALKMLFAFDVINIFTAGAISTVDSNPLNLAFWFSSILIYSLSVKLFSPNNSLVESFLITATIVFSTVALIGLNQKIPWLVLALCLMGLFILQKKVLQSLNITKKFLIPSLTCAAILFGIFGTPAILSYETGSVLSIRISDAASILKTSTLSSIKNFLIGSGPGTYDFVYSSFSSSASEGMGNGFRFNSSVNSLFTIISESGMVVTAILLFLIAIFYSFGFGYFGRVIKRVESKEEDVSKVGLPEALITPNFESVLPFLTIFPFTVITASMLFTNLGFSLWFFWWFFLALGVSGFGIFNEQGYRYFEYLFSETPEKKVSLYFYSSVFVLFLVVILFFSINLLRSDRFVAKALAAGDFESAKSDLLQAIKYHDTAQIRDITSKLFFARAIEASRINNKDLQKISELMASAVVEGKKAVELSPNSSARLIYLASLYEQTMLIAPEARNFAISALEKALEIEKNNAQLFIRIGNDYAPEINGNENCRLIACDWGRAIDNYERALQLEPGNVDYLNLLANAYEKSKKPDEAIETYSKISKRQPESEEVQYNYGRLLYNRNEKGDREQAETIWLKVLEMNPNYSNVLFSLGVLYELKNDYKKALEYFNRVKQLNPLKEDQSNIDAVKAVDAKIRMLNSKR